ncbi:MAG: hypothetical protein K2Q19_08375 [Rhodocyclaceae bacterium]|nr:hypothetical protein [Rhodocyclaceae bacterium]
MRHLIIKTAFATTLGIAAVSSAFAYADDENTRFSATTSEPTANERAPYGYVTNGQPERIPSGWRRGRQRGASGNSSKSAERL